MSATDPTPAADPVLLALSTVLRALPLPEGTTPEGGVTWGLLLGLAVAKREPFVAGRLATALASATQNPDQTPEAFLGYFDQVAYLIGDLVNGHYRTTP